MLAGHEVKRPGGRHGMVFGHAPVTPQPSPPIITTVEPIVTPPLSFVTTLPQTPLAVPLSVIQPGTQRSNKAS